MKDRGSWCTVESATMKSGAIVISDCDAGKGSSAILKMQRVVPPFPSLAWHRRTSKQRMRTQHPLYIHHICPESVVSMRMFNDFEV